MVLIAGAHERRPARDSSNVVDRAWQLDREAKIEGQIELASHRALQSGSSLQRLL